MSVADDIRVLSAVSHVSHMNKMQSEWEEGGEKKRGHSHSPTA